MEYSLSGQNLTKYFEQCRLTSYWDKLGLCWTRGWGHTGSEVAGGQTITQKQADDDLAYDCQASENAVNVLVKVPLTQGEFDALVDFVFNLGSSRLAKSTLLGLLNSGNYMAAAVEIDKWDHAGGKEVAGLLRRRQAETAEFNAGWNDGTAQS